MDSNGQQTNGSAGGECCMRPRIQVPNAPIKCKWRINSTESSPHSCRPNKKRPKILSNVLEAVGDTPVIKLSKIPQSAGLKCDIYVKCEFMNPGGSIKDRISVRMVEEAEEQGLLKPGYTVIEATSGNTGLGLAMVCAIKGYRCIIVMSKKMSNEKVDTLRALGAEIAMIPIGEKADSPDGMFGVAERFNKSIPNSILLNQFKNYGNPLAHYDTTATELLDTFNGEIDMIVMGSGTGGTITGVGRKMKEACPQCKIVAADPYGSVMAEPKELNKTDVGFFEMEGIGYEFVPTALDRSVVDFWYKTDDKNSFSMARRLIKEEGLLCGGSSGAVVYAAVQVAKDLKKGQKCVVLLPDGLRNYMTKFLDPIWLEARNLQEPEERPFPWWNKLVSSIKVDKIDSILPTVNIKKALDIMKTRKINEIPVIDKEGNIHGVVTLSYCMNQFNLLSAKTSDNVSQILNTTFRKITPTTTLGLVSRILEKEPFVMLVKQEKASNGGIVETYHGIITTRDLLDQII